MNGSWLNAILISGLLALGTSSCRAEEKPEKPGAEFAGYVLSDVPKDVENPMFIDFGGKVHLVGYNIEPKGIVTPGSKVKLTLFWRSHQRLGPGWRVGRSRCWRSTVQSRPSWRHSLARAGKGMCSTAGKSRRRPALPAA